MTSATSLRPAEETGGTSSRVEPVLGNFVQHPKGRCCAAMTSRLDRLVDSSLVTREVDRRRLLVRPTEAGRNAWNDYVHEGMAREQQLFHALLRKVVLSHER